MLRTIARRILPGLTLMAWMAANVQAQNTDWASKMFDRQSVDFGVLARGSEAAIRVKITNIYKETVRIAGVSTTCGCAAASPSQTVLGSRETAYVEVRMDTQRFIRKKDSNLIVRFDQPGPAEVRIPITAYIRTDVVLTPGGVNFGTVDQGTSAQRKVNIAYAGRDNWTIKEVQSDNRFLNAQVVETSRGGGRVGYELVVDLADDAPPGTLRQQITLVTDDANSKHVPVIVEARVEADISVTEVVSLGTLTPGASKTVNVVLRGKKPFAIEKIDFDDRSFTFSLPTNARQVHVVPMTVIPPDSPGELREEFSVKISGRDEPVVFKAFGRIAE
jgi:hypothetical protein